MMRKSHEAVHGDYLPHAAREKDAMVNNGWRWSEAPLEAMLSPNGEGNKVMVRCT